MTAGDSLSMYIETEQEKKIRNREYLSYYKEPGVFHPGQVRQAKGRMHGVTRGLAFWVPQVPLCLLRTEGCSSTSFPSITGQEK